jgi:hypothetical protein
MLPITAWKSLLVAAAFLTIPAAILLPAKHEPIVFGVPNAGSEAEYPTIPYVKPSPFTLPAAKTSRRPKSVFAVGNRPTV